MNHLNMEVTTFAVAIQNHTEPVICKASALVRDPASDHVMAIIAERSEAW